MDFKVEQQLVIKMSADEALDLQLALDENSIVWQSNQNPKYLGIKKDFINRLHYELNPASAVPQKGNGN